MFWPPPSMKVFLRLWWRNSQLSICDSILLAALHGCCFSSKERGSLSNSWDHGRSRPADIFLPNWSGGLAAALDITIISPMQSLTLERSAITPGHALRIAEDWKLAAHGKECRLEGVKFHSFGFGVFGGLGPEPHRRRESHWSSAGTATRIWPIRDYPTTGTEISISFRKGNATLWTTRQRPCPASVDGILWSYV